MRIRKISIEASNPAELREFYQSILQLATTKEGSRHIVQIGNSTLQIEQATAGEPFYHFAINIPSNKIEEAREWLKSKVKLLWMEDYKSDIADFVNWHAKSVYFFDAAGNIVELIARFDLRNETDEMFSSSQFLSINEIGIVFR